MADDRHYGLAGHYGGCVEQPCSDPYHGQCIVRRHHNDCDVYITLERADPQILVCDQVLHDIHDDPHVDVWLDMPERAAPDYPDGMLQQYPDAPLTDPLKDTSRWSFLGHVADGQPVLARPLPELYDGALLHIDARNQHVIYRIGTYRLDVNAWEAAWPD